MSAGDEPGDTTLTSLVGLTSGRFIVSTLSGARHLVDLDARAVTRFPAAGHARHVPGRGFGPLTDDGLVMRFTRLAGTTVSRRLYVANDSKWRLSSTVLAIARVDDPGP